MEWEGSTWRGRCLIQLWPRNIEAASHRAEGKII